IGLWVRTDAGLLADAAGRVSVWTDQSGTGNDLAQSTLTSQPGLVRDAVNGFPVLRFDGSNGWLNFTARFDKNIRAIFAVLKENSDGNTWRSFLSDSTNATQDFYPGYATLWTGGYTSPAVLNGQTWLNGTAVDGTQTSRPQTMSVLSVLSTAGVT